jgi:hypothetical protein
MLVVDCGNVQRLVSIGTRYAASQKLFCKVHVDPFPVHGPSFAVGVKSQNHLAGATKELRGQLGAWDIKVFNPVLNRTFPGCNWRRLLAALPQPSWLPVLNDPADCSHVQRDRRLAQPSRELIGRETIQPPLVDLFERDWFAHPLKKAAYRMPRMISRRWAALSPRLIYGDEVVAEVADWLTR